jgi:deoxycytidine triphosphate deaminase
MTSVRRPNRNRYGVAIRWLRPQDIFAAVERDQYLIVDPFDRSMVRTNGGLDIKVNKLVAYESGSTSIDDRPTVEQEFDSIDLRPGQSALFLGAEYLEFPQDMMAIITLRSRYAMRLVWPFGMGLVRLGWRGHLVFEIANVSSYEVTTINKNDAIASLDIFQLDLA